MNTPVQGTNLFALAIDTGTPQPWGELAAIMLPFQGRMRNAKDVVFRKNSVSPCESVRLKKLNTLIADLDKIPPDIQSIVIAGIFNKKSSTTQLRMKARVGTIISKHEVEIPSAGRFSMTIGTLRRWGGGWRFDSHPGQRHDSFTTLLSAYSEFATNDPMPSQSMQSRIDIRRQRTEVMKTKDPDLAMSAENAIRALIRHEAENLTAQVALVIDISISMLPHFESGGIDRLIMQVLAMGFELDDDGCIDIFLFGHDAYDYGRLNEKRYKGFTDEFRRDHQLETNTFYSKAIEMVLDSYKSQASNDPVLVLFVTDGDTNDKEKTETLMKQASKKPFFWQFLAIGSNPGANQTEHWIPDGFSFLEHLDNMKERAVDNASFTSVENPGEIADDFLFDVMLKEFKLWTIEAKKAGIIQPTA